MEIVIAGVGGDHTGPVSLVGDGCNIHPRMQMCTGHRAVYSVG